MRDSGVLDYVRENPRMWGSILCKRANDTGRVAASLKRTLCSVKMIQVKILSRRPRLQKHSKGICEDDDIKSSCLEIKE